MDNQLFSQESLFEMIRIVTVSLAEIWKLAYSLRYAEMMTIRLAEIKPEPMFSEAVEVRAYCTETGSHRLKQEHVGTIA